VGCLFFLVRARFGLEDRAGPPSDLPMHARRLPSPPPASTRRLARRAGRRALLAGVAQLAEHLFCKQVVGGSSPPASSTFNVYLGGLPERPKGAGCKPAGIAYVGSNPTPSTGFCVPFCCGVDGGRPWRSRASFRRSRRFVVRAAASVADVDLFFQDSRVAAGEACASRTNVYSAALPEGSGGVEGLGRAAETLGAGRAFNEELGGGGRCVWALNNKSAIARGENLHQNSRPSVLRGSSSTGRASAFQAERRGFESLLPLYKKLSDSGSLRLSA
jgi:hypothetical protein